MELKNKTYLYSYFDNQLIKEFDAAYKFIAQQTGLSPVTETIQNLTITLKENEFLIFIIDEITLAQFSNKGNWGTFIENNKSHLQNVLLVIDDVKLKLIPDYFSQLQFFYLSRATQWMNEDEDTGIEQSKKTLILQTVIDIVNYQKRILNPSKGFEVTVFLAPADDHTLPVFQKILRELQNRDLNLSPIIINPSAKDLIENPEGFKTLLKQASISVHFIGHDTMLEYPEKEAPVLKVNRLVSEFCQTIEGKHLERLIYIPDNSLQFDETLDRKINAFKSELKNFHNAELIQTPVEKFKSIVLAKIKQLHVNNQKTTTNTQSSDHYFIYPPGGDLHVKGYIELLKNSGINYSVSQVQLDQLELLHYHQKQLTNCLGSIIYYDGNSKWFQRKLSDLVKSPGWGRKIPYGFVAIVGQEPDQKLLEPYKFLPISYLGNKPEKLEQYLMKLSTPKAV